LKILAAKIRDGEAHANRLLGARQPGALILGDIEGAQADIAAGKCKATRRCPWRRYGGEGVGVRTMSSFDAIFEHAPGHAFLPDFLRLAPDLP